MPMLSVSVLCLWCLAAGGGLGAAGLDSVPVSIREGHPRLLVNSVDWPRMRRYADDDARYRRIVGLIRAYADELLEQPLVERKTRGTHVVRILHSSRDALRRITALGMLAQLEGASARGDVYRARLIEETMAACAFSDWQPERFLATGEMSMAVALAYDWCYAHFTPEQRATIRRSLVDKAFAPSFAQDHWWLDFPNNHNQVDHGGLIAAALAVAEDEPEWARRILERARTGIRPGLSTYAPDGVYHEGAGYWGYGTLYSLLTAGVLDSATGDDWGILDAPGFARSFAFAAHMIGPTHRLFNFADSGERWDAATGFHHYAYAALSGQEGLLPAIVPHLDDSLDRLADKPGRIYRALGLLLAWYRPAATDAGTLPRTFLGRGPTEVHAQRSS